MENKEVHVRFCCCSQPFTDLLLEWGFKEKGSDPPHYGLKQVRRFCKKNLEVEDSYAGLYLYATVEKVRQLKYHGLSVNKELFENFARKGIYNQ